MYVRCELKVKDKFIYKLNRNYNTCFYVKKIVQIVYLGKLALREKNKHYIHKRGLNLVL